MIVPYRNYYVNILPFLSFPHKKKASEVLAFLRLIVNCTIGETEKYKGVDPASQSVACRIYYMVYRKDMASSIPILPNLFLTSQHAAKKLRSRWVTCPYGLGFTNMYSCISVCHRRPQAIGRRNGSIAIPSDLFFYPQILCCRFLLEHSAL